MGDDAGTDATIGLDASTDPCLVVVGADAVAARRADDPDVAIVALVDAASPNQAVLAQAAGADIVLPTSGLTGDRPEDTPGLQMAVQAASTLAHRRSAVSSASRRVAHDLAGAFNVIGLAAELGGAGTSPAPELFAQIHSLARDADADAWRAGRADRSARRSVGAVDVLRLVHGPATSGDDIEVDVPTGHLWVFADERQLTWAITELLTNARRAGAKRIRVRVDAVDGEIEIVVSDDGAGFTPDQLDALAEPHTAPAASGRLGLGLATIAEFAHDLGGQFEALDTEPTAWSSKLRLALPGLDGPTGQLAQRTVVMDQASAQASILERVVRNAPLAESLDAIVAAIEDHLPDTACSVLLLRDGRSLHHGAGARLPAAYRAAIDGVIIGRGQGSCGTAAYTGRPVVATDVETDPNWVNFRDVALEHDLRSCWSTPIVAAEDGEVLGTFAVYKSTRWGPDQAAIRLVRRFTYLAAVAIEHDRLFGALAESESRFRSAFEGATAGLALVHLDGRILQANPALSALLAQPTSSLLSSNLLDVVHSDWVERVQASWDLLAAGQPIGEVPPTIEAPLRPATPALSDDEPVWISLSTSLISIGGEWTLYVEVRDVTAARRHLQEQRARESAEASNQAKTDFLTLVSHELRTPLNAILGFAQVMQLSGLDLDDDQRLDSVEQIVRAGEHLRDLINELLDLSRIEAGQLAVHTETVDPHEVIREALDLVGPLASARGIALADHRPDTVRHHVTADRKCLRQVLINLLANAVKYTPTNGRVAVTVSSTPASPDLAGTTRITVHDTGSGIAAESIDQLFQPFRRLGDENERRPEGTGLGLALTARLMAEMGGEIGVDSTVGVGSGFWVEFPSADEPIEDRSDLDTITVGPGPGAEADEISPAETTARVVLYVEDDDASVEVMRAALAARPGIELRTARNAAAGTAQLTAGDIDVVLLDIGLPDRSGWDLLGDIRRSDPTLPVVVLTASTEPAPASAPEPDQLLTKPLGISDVLLAVDVALERTASGDHAAEGLDPIEQ